MFFVLFVLFIVVPIAEVAAFVAVADAIGALPAIGWIVLVSVAGAWLVKREGLQALRRANEKVAAGELPTRELVNGVLILFAGALLLTPGFVTDLVGLLLLLPPTRALLAIPLTRRFQAGPIMAGSVGQQWVFGSSFDGTGFDGTGPRIRNGTTVVDADSWDVTDSADRPELP